MTEARQFRAPPEDVASAAYPEQFFLKVLPWYVGNHPADINTTGMLEEGDICMPAPWCEEPTLLAFSREGYEQKTWPLPEDWRGVNAVRVARLGF